MRLFTDPSDPALTRPEIEDLPQPVTEGVETRYSYCAVVGDRLNNNRSNSNPFDGSASSVLRWSPDQAVWVCKSKGQRQRRRRRHGRIEGGECPEPATVDGNSCCSASDKDTSTTHHHHHHNYHHACITNTNDGEKKNPMTPQERQPHSRMELYLRARVVSVEPIEAVVGHNGSCTGHGSRGGSSPVDLSVDMLPRVRVQYPQGSTYAVRADRLMVSLDATVVTVEHPRVLVYPETDVYRRACVIHTQPDEDFCEIGCAQGRTCQRVWATGHREGNRKVVGIDKSESAIQTAQQKYPDCTFVVGDILAPSWTTSTTNTAAAASTLLLSLPSPSSLSPHPPPTVVAVDINGNRELQAVLQCLQVVMDRWKPRLILVKSRSLYYRLASNHHQQQQEEK